MTDAGVTPAPPGAPDPPPGPRRGDARPAAHRRTPPYRPRPRGWVWWAPRLATAAAVLGVIGVTVWQLNPHLLLSNTSTTGGDTGAHYMLPQYLKSNLLTHGRLTGWDPAWYDGFPLYVYYFVLPDLWAALTSVVLGYNVAFKLATVLGSLALPVAAWACGRLFRLRRPLPALLAVATLPFLFDYTWTIYGGNLFSTLAGEYAYSLSVALAVLFLGLFARGLRTGRGRGLAAVTFALCLAAHVVPALFALAGAVVLTALELVPARWRLTDDGFAPFRSAPRAPGRDPVRPAPATVWWGASTAVVGLALSSWWLVPFVADRAYANSMGYTNVTTWYALLYPVADRWLIWMAVASAVLAVATMSRFGIFVTVMGGLSVLALVADPQGSLYNTRFLPLYFLCAYLLAGWGFGTATVAAARALRRARWNRWVAATRRGGPAPPRPRAPRWTPGAVGGPLLGLLAACIVVVPPFLVTDGVLPGWVLPNPPGAQVTEWAHYNYIGYEGQPAYPELQAVTAMMRRAGATDGCGRAMWQYDPTLDRFGTPMALMLLPFWTNGCIDSMEGLLFESSATTPYHFLNQAELSEEPSDPQVGLDYGPLNIPLGVRHLQLLGVRYFLASSPNVEQLADHDPSLVPLASTGPFRQNYGGKELATTWKLYLVKDSQLVTPLRNQPVVWTGVTPAQGSWLAPSESWYLDPAQWGVERAAGGPAAWPRRAPGAPVPRIREPATTVTGIRTSDSGLSFHVSRTGTPVLVKVSYFPNWQASGAEGPWRVTPNLMVVVPTSHQVTLTYGTSNAEVLGLAVSGLGVLAVAVPWIVGVVRRRRAA